MKNIVGVGVLCVVALSLAAGQSATNVQDEIKKVEQDWAQANIKSGAAAVDQYEADDIVKTDPSGHVTDKAQDKTDLGSGDLKFESMELSDMTVHTYGDTAVAAGTNKLRGTYKGQDISGKYRFTDTWVKRNGKWQVVANAVEPVGGPDAATVRKMRGTAVSGADR